MTSTNHSQDLDNALQKLNKVHRKKDKKMEGLDLVQKYAIQYSMKGTRNRYTRRVMDFGIAAIILVALGTFIFQLIDFNFYSPAGPSIPGNMEEYISERYNMTTLKGKEWDRVDIGMIDSLTFMLEDEGLSITLSTFFGSISTSANGINEPQNLLQKAYEESNDYKEFVRLSKEAYINNNSGFGFDSSISLVEVDQVDDVPIFRVEGLGRFYLIAFTVSEEQPYIFVLHWNTRENTLDDLIEQGFYDIYIETITYTKPYQTVNHTTDAYVFPVREGTEEWSQLINLEQMLDATQIPTDILSSISTAGLVETVMHYPLLLNMYAYNSPQEGFDVVSKQFNGLEELLKRQDAGTELFVMYRLHDPHAIEEDWEEIRQAEYIFSIRIMEKILAQEEILKKLSSLDRYKLLGWALQVYLAKEELSDIYGTSIMNTVWLMGKILEKENYEPFVQKVETNYILRSFLKSGFHLENLQEVLEHAKQFYSEQH